MRHDRILFLARRYPPSLGGGDNANEHSNSFGTLASLNVSGRGAGAGDVATTVAARKLVDILRAMPDGEVALNVGLVGGILSDERVVPREALLVEARAERRGRALAPSCDSARS